MRRRACWRARSARFGADLSGRRFALWGLAFKPNTDDMREAPSRASSPTCWRAARRSRLRSGGDGRSPPRLRREPRIALPPRRWTRSTAPTRWSIVTEWKEFRSPDFDAMKRRLKTPVIFDGRNLYDPAQVRAAGIEYHAIGRLQ
jgi:UDPglucose 6-dehydrogenase